MSLKLPFDIYQRYKFASEKILEFDAKSILDVGAGDDKYLTSFLTETRQYFSIDLYGGDVIADATNLPFSNKAFDMVLCLDVLEYIDRDKQKKLIEELQRVGKKVLISTPVNTSKTEAAEKGCSDFYIWLRGSPYPWLSGNAEEGRKNLGLPKEDEILKMINREHVETFPNGHLSRWETMMKLNFLLSLSLLQKPLYTALNYLYNALFYRIDNKKPAFRTFFLIKE